MFREIKASDAAAFQLLLQQLYNDTEFMLFSPGENVFSIKKMSKIIEKRKDKSSIIVAEENDNLLGYIYVSRGRLLKNNHVGTVAMGVIKKC